MYLRRWDGPWEDTAGHRFFRLSQNYQVLVFHSLWWSEHTFFDTSASWSLHFFIHPAYMFVLLSFTCTTLPRGESGPHLVLAPLSVMNSWADEFRKWCPSMKVLGFRINSCTRLIVCICFCICPFKLVKCSSISRKNNFFTVSTRLYVFMGLQPNEKDCVGRFFRINAMSFFTGLKAPIFSRNSTVSLSMCVALLTKC